MGVADCCRQSQLAPSETAANCAVSSEGRRRARLAAMLPASGTGELLPALGDAGAAECKWQGTKVAASRKP